MFLTQPRRPLFPFAGGFLVAICVIFAAAMLIKAGNRLAEANRHAQAKAAEAHDAAGKVKRMPALEWVFPPPGEPDWPRGQKQIAHNGMVDFPPELAGAQWAAKVVRVDEVECRRLSVKHPDGGPQFLVVADKQYCGAWMISHDRKLHAAIYSSPIQGTWIGLQDARTIGCNLALAIDATGEVTLQLIEPGKGKVRWVDIAELREVVDLLRAKKAQPLPQAPEPPVIIREDEKP
jgi:hypothetical protein